jgi:hypothetical protein
VTDVALFVLGVPVESILDQFFIIEEYLALDNNAVHTHDPLGVLSGRNFDAAFLFPSLSSLSTLHLSYPTSLSEGQSQVTASGHAHPSNHVELCSCRGVASSPTRDMR